MRRLRFPRVHPDAAVALVAILGVAGLFVAEHLLAPPLLPIAVAATRDGERVTVEGRVLFVSHTSHGRLVALASDGARIDALAGAGDGPARGDVVRATGVVLRGALSLERLDLVANATSRPLDPADVARSPADYDGARLLLRGDAKGGALVGSGARIALAGLPAPAPEGGTWLVEGVFRYHPTDASYVFAAESWTRPR